MSADPRIADAGTKKSIKDSDMTGATLNAGNQVTVWSEQVPADKLYAHGYGSDSRNNGRTSYIYADLVASGAGTGSAGDSIGGDLELVVTDSQQKDVLARYSLGDIQSLRDAASESRTDRPTHPALAPLAQEDRHLEIRVTADAGSDGVVVDPSASDARLFYTDIDR